MGTVLTRPNSYRETYVINGDTAYREADDVPGRNGQPSQGCLHRGRVVWLENDPPLAEKSIDISAYAEGIGVIRLRTGCLHRARLLRDRA
jgi:hypothetical protein